MAVAKNNEYLIDLVRDLQRLNKADVKILQADIKHVIKNPEQYALDMAEIMFARNMPRYIKAFKAGEYFAKRNLKTESELNG